MRTLKITDFIDDDFPFALNEPKDQPRYPIHAHDFTELVIIHNGTGTNVVKGDKFHMVAGDVFVLKPDLEHEYKDTHNLFLTSILMDLDHLPLPFEMLGMLPGYYSLFEVEPRLRRKHAFRSRLQIDSEQMATVNYMLKRLWHEWNTKNVGYRAAIIGILTELMVFLSRCFTPESTSTESLAVTRLGEVVSRIETGYSHPITLDDLAKTAHMSKRSLLRYFNNVFNMSPINYLLKVRLARASELLIKTDKPITMISTETGFTDSNYFTRQFHRAMNMSPSEYRKRFTVNKPSQ